MGQGTETMGFETTWHWGIEEVTIWDARISMAPYILSSMISKQLRVTHEHQGWVLVQLVHSEWYTQLGLSVRN